MEKKGHSVRTIYKISFSAMAIIIAAMVFLMNPVMTVEQATSQVSNGNATDNRQVIFGCEPIGGSIHCDRLSNKLDSYLLQASTDKIYNVTRGNDDISFVQGVRGGGALEFKAYFGEFLNIDNNPRLNPQQFSISFWTKHSTIGFENYGHVMSHVNAGITSGWLFDVGNTTSQSIRFGVANDNGTAFYTKDASVSDSGFTHIVGTFDGTSVKLYQNGTLTDAVPFSGNYDPDPDVPIKIAMSSYNFGFPWTGIIDEIRMYSKPLGEAEVKTLYNSTSFPSVGVIGYWPFDENIEDVAGHSPTQYIIQTVGMAFAPDGRLFFTEKNTGKVRIMMTNQNDTVLAEPFAVVPSLRHDMEQGLLGIAIDPEFDQNHYVYAYYTAQRANDTSPVNRVVRFTDDNNIGKNMTVIIDGIPAHRGGMHAGGAIAFGPTDGKLYITIGNAYRPEEAQDVSSILGKVLRINKDGTVPEDNPFSNSPVYTIGHRNSYGIAFDKSGNGIVTENGDDLYDEINILVKGGNYGYPTMQPPNASPVLAAENSTDSIEPVRSYWKTVAPTQATYYDGTKFSELTGKFLLGSYNNGRLYALDVNPENGTVSELKIQVPYKMQSNIIAVAQSPLTGDIYYGGYYIYKLESIDADNIEPILATVSVRSDHEITNLVFDNAEKMIMIEANATQPIVIEIPKLLLDGITTVSLDIRGTENLEFDVQDKDSVNMLTIQAKETEQPVTIYIRGNTTSLLS